MAYVPVPKDLARVKSKVAFNLTRRQIVCFALAGVTALPVYFLTKPLLGQTIAGLLLVALALPFFLLAMYEKDGMPFEQVLGHIVRVKWLCPADRPYVTKNLYELLDAKNPHQEDVKRGKPHK